MQFPLRTLATLAFLAVNLHGTLAAAQSARANFLIQMLRTNSDARVRTNAALRLGELHEAASVEAILQVFATETDTTVRATLAATLGAIGDARAISALESATRGGQRDVAVQARRAIGLIQAASSSGERSATTTPPPTTATPVVLITTGTVNVQAAGGATFQRIAQEALEQALDRRGEVVRHRGAAAAARTVIRTQRLRGAHQFDANLQSITPQGNGVRVAVSIVVSSFPGRAYEFDASSTITVSGGTPGIEGQRGAVATAMQSVVNRALTQVLASMR
ncbi:MAG: HEAT repeat domain-containing protein [Deltaproteobacteria bacterium]|nr:HEAT repeat domain-containing protein [Deltaproteobacteria bacterium]